jgi:hypothetical protein
MRRALILLGLTVIFSTGSAWAQSSVGRTSGQLQATAALRALSLRAETTVRPQLGAAVASTQDHRWEGLALGAAVMGLTGALLLRGACEENESCTGPTIGGFMMGALVGGVVGGLVGGTIPKREK